MDIKIRKITSEDADAYVSFFDTTEHDDNVAEHKCYCVCWCSDDYEGKDFSKVEYRREAARQYVREGTIKGYLAFEGDRIVGWCNANTKSECLKCASWRRFMDYVPLEEETEIKVKSIFCYVIAPEMKRKGIATSFLDRICEDSKQEGFDYVEAYPYKESSYQSSDFGGHYAMYEKKGFMVSAESEMGLVMRKKLK